MYSVAIDGPAGSGKSTVAKMLAKELDISYIDTGAMYRAIAYKAKKNSAITEEDIKKLLIETDIDYKDGKIYLDGDDISENIRTEEISKMASDISKYKFVREFLVFIQQKIAKKISVVMEGRDIGTVVLKDAKYKFFLTATVDIRAKRRYEQLLKKGEIADFEMIREDLINRDYNDSHRENSPLKKADDAYLVDNSNLDLRQTLDYMLDIIRGKNVL
ncbi:(d)CMP kinase [Peptoniphilus sp. oral taxon 386]|uniref:(d)CMP kinase n=1 Tax=Peptoniphilus sp. oral taxon 386 TaxID=652713 RepID=UPI0001DA9BE9|nr:(d)CMP kinase [Peptoniphilus sp. oral taxon 386]EFI42588.1 cytidylate kinase [Peptoniphilus sp. oral taxon 386 str. F0131]